MKRLLILFIAINLANLLKSQNFLYEWVKGNGMTGASVVYSVKTDSANNIYIAGSFSGTTDFDFGPNTFNLTAPFGGDIFFAKYRANGNLVYAKTIGGAASDDVISIATDDVGSVYLTGYFQATVDFDPGAGIQNITSTGPYDIFFAKYDSLGNYILAKGLINPTSGNDAGNTIDVDKNLNIYVAGYFTGTPDFDPGPGTYTLSSTISSKDIFFAKYDKNGNFLFAKKIGGGSDDVCNGLVLDKHKNIYLTGNSIGAIDFDPGPATQNVNAIGGGDIFYAKYDSLGNYIFAKTIGCTGIDNGRSIALDSQKNIFLTGMFNTSPNDFDPGPSTASLMVGGFNDIYFAKYDSLGNYIFAKSISGGGQDEGIAVAIDYNDNILLTGFYNSASVDFDPGPGNALLSAAGNRDIFLAKYDNSGNYTFAKSIGNSLSQEMGYTVTSDRLGNIIIGGTFYGISIDFDPGIGTSFLSGIGNSGFVAKYDNTSNYIFAGNLPAHNLFNSNCKISETKSDRKGNLYTIGTYSGNLSFSTLTGNSILTSNGLIDVFFTKIDSIGNYIYAKSLGGPLSDAGTSVSFDTTGNIYLTGSFLNTVDFDPGPSTYNLSSVGGEDIFCAKYDGSGNLVYAFKFGGSSNDKGTKICSDINGNIYLTGTFDGTSIDFDPGASVNALSSSGGNDIFFAKYNTSGNYVYAKSIGGFANDQSNGLSIDMLGKVYISGYFQGTADFDPGPAVSNLFTAGNNDIFFANYDQNGNFLFAKSIGSSSDDQSNSLELDASKNIYLIGNFGSTADFDPGLGTSTIVPNGLKDIFFARYDSLGNYFFANKIGGSANDNGTSICLNNSNEIIITGSFQNSNVDFNPGPGTNNLSSNGNTDIFFARYTSTGNYIAAGSLGNINAEEGASATADSKGGVYFSGYFNGIVDFDFTSSSALLGTANDAGYIAKYSFCSAPSLSLSLSSFTGCTNGSPITLTGSPSGGVYSGIAVSGNTFSPPAAPGNYTVTYTYTNSTGCSNYINDVIVLTVCVEVIELKDINNTLNLFPNPSNGSFKIVSTYNTSVDLITELGQIITVIELNDSNENTFIIENLRSGVYFIVGNEIKKKVVVINQN